MFQKDKNLIDLFKKITAVHFLTDYSSVDYQYPPVFAWDEFSDEKFSGMKDKFLSGNYNLYVHFPFCVSKCKFCRQFSLVNYDKRIFKEYVSLLVQELRIYSELISGFSLSNIYFGGGTPTLFPLEIFFNTARKYVEIEEGAQINVESTPESLTCQKIKMLKKAGVNRLLMGAQSLDPKVLKTINRFQNKQHFMKMYYCAKKEGIPVINVELVAGLPSQTMKSFLGDLKTVIRMKPESIHIYPYFNMPLTVFYKNGYRITKKQRQLCMEMVKLGGEMLKGAGYTYLGDDYCLDKETKSRNQVVAGSGESDGSGLKPCGTLALGLSAVGSLSLNNGNLLQYINSFNYQKHKESVLKNQLPIAKYFLFNRQEKLRMHFIRRYRYGFAQVKKKEIETLRPAIEFLKKCRKIEIKNRGGNAEIIFLSPPGFVYSKIFYSPEILEKCRKIIDGKYSKINASDILKQSIPYENLY